MSAGGPAADSPEATQRHSEVPGAKSPQDPSDDRTPPQRDRDRILYSTAFRRMAGKTQVISVAELGMYHTRLTHSLKVAQLGRRMAERLFRLHGLPDPDVVEAACLAHDLGHPPFGHAGEQALQAAFDGAVRAELKSASTVKPEEASAVASEGSAAAPAESEAAVTADPLHVRGGFEGNAQSFRILTRLAIRSPKPWGLDLTRATLDACSKYPWARGENPKKPDKWGVYPDDREMMAWVRQGAEQGTTCFEADLMDWCDDVAYAVHDVMDFYRGGFIPLEQLFRMHRADKHVPVAAESLVADIRKNARSPLKEADDAQLLVIWQRLALLFEIFEGWTQARGQKAALQGSTSNLISYFMSDVGFAGAAPCRYDGTFSVSSNEKEACTKKLAVMLLQHMIWHYVIERPQLRTQQAGQRKIVTDLFTIFLAHPDLLPFDRMEELEVSGDKLRTAADHIASFTEAGAYSMHARLTGVRIGAITDVVSE